MVGILKWSTQYRQSNVPLIDTPVEKLKVRNTPLEDIYIHTVHLEFFVVPIYEN